MIMKIGKANACEANPNVSPNCPVVVPVVPTTTGDRVTAADWVASFNGTLRSQPDADNLESSFLEGTADGLNSGTLTTSLSHYEP